MLTPIEFAAIALDKSTQMPMLVLREVGGQATISMTVGHEGANEVAAQVMGIERQRATTFDFIKALLERWGATLSKVVIDAQGESSLAARLYLRLASRVEVIECPPADAVTLALRCAAPIFATRRALDRSSLPNQAESAQELRDSIARLETLEFGRCFLE